jgi:hypothetical protein
MLEMLKSAAEQIRNEEYLRTEQTPEHPLPTTCPRPKLAILFLIAILLLTAGIGTLVFLAKTNQPF